jgi:hypothetical protein
MTSACLSRMLAKWCFCVLVLLGRPLDADEHQMQLWKQVPLGELSGGFVLPADLTGDGQAELLLSYAQRYSAHVRLVAVDLQGQVLWSYGDASVSGQDFGGGEPPCRPPITAYDFNGDGQVEVVAEFWNDGQPQLVVLAGATGQVLRQIDSPFGMPVRQPDGYRPSRPAPQAMVARLDGPDRPASVVVKYETSGRIPALAVAYDHELNKRWEIRDRQELWSMQGASDMGHHAIVTDLTGDGRDDIVFGQLAVDSDGQPIFRRDFPQHADGIDVFTLDGETRLLITICNTGPAYCLTADGKTVWEKTQQEVSHGQAGWVGNFLPDRPGLEAVILVSGHYGIFHTFDAEDGRKLAAFEHHAGLEHPDGSRKYPDMPIKVRWRNGEDSLWVPVDRMILDGRGRVVARLGEMDARVVRELRPGDTKNQLAVQAVPVDLCGDEREEVILYQPYHGKAVYIFTQADSDAAEKPYRPQTNAYNRPSYF